MLKRLSLLILAPGLLFAAAQKEQLSIAKTKTSPLLDELAGGERGVQGIILDYLSDDRNFVLSKTIKVDWPPLLAYSNDGKDFAAYENGDICNGEMIIFDSTTGNEIGRTPKKIDSAIEPMRGLTFAFSFDGRLAITGRNDGTIEISDRKTGELINTLSGHTSPIISLVWNPRGNSFASGSADGTIKIWKRQDIAMAEAQEVDQ